MQPNNTSLQYISFKMTLSLLLVHPLDRNSALLVRNMKSTLVLRTVLCSFRNQTCRVKAVITGLSTPFGVSVRKFWIQPHNHPRIFRYVTVSRYNVSDSNVSRIHSNCGEMEIMPSRALLVSLCSWVG